jgi:excisionase family DNA binding protein
MEKASDQKLALSIDETSRRTGICRDVIYRAIREGDLPARKCGRRTLILQTELHDYLHALPRAASSNS